MLAGIDLVVSNLDELDGRLLVVFDGRCGFCNRSVRWFLRRDRYDRLRFVPYESSEITDFRRRHGFAAGEGTSIDLNTDPSTILVVQQAGLPTENVLVRSDAVIRLLSQLPRPWPALAKLMRLMPRPLRDLAYRLVARSRFTFFKRLESCPIPTAAERARFL
jgi:predicted DCC family thiol-disulfide oxidoreductase YuxK